MKAKNYISVFVAFIFCAIQLSAQTNTCPPPSGMAVSNITSNSATLSWNAVTGAANYQVQYRVSPSGTWQTLTTINTSVNLTGLSAQMYYEWQVRSCCPGSNGTIVCGNFSQSSFFFTSGSTNICLTPTGLTASNIASTSALLSWSNTGATSYEINYRPTGSVSWTATTSATNSKIITSLTPATAYEWRARGVCTNSTGTTYSPWSALAYFTTPPQTNICPTPTGLTSTNITGTSAVLAWNSTGASSYEIRYRPVGSLTWATVNSVTNSVIITGLIPATYYEWRVRGKCFTGTNTIKFSFWSVVANFTTLQQTTCPVPTGLTSTIGTVGNSVLLAWNSTGATSYNIRYKVLNTTAWINTTSATNSKLLTGLLSTTYYEWQAQSVCTANGVIITSAWSASAYFVTLSPLRLTPNPADEKISVAFESNVSGQLNFVVRNIFGTAVLSQNKPAAEGTNAVELNTSSLQNGMYYLEFNSESGKHTQKFYIQHE